MSNDQTTAPDATSDDGELHNSHDTTAADHTDEPDPVAELARWKQLARRHEDRAKTNAAAARELETLKAAQMTEVERAVNDAKTATRAEVMREVGATRVEDQVRVAAAGRALDVESLIAGMNPTRFMDDDGQPDVKAIVKWVDTIAPADTTGPRVPQVPTGQRDTSRNVQPTPADQFAEIMRTQLNNS